MKPAWYYQRQAQQAEAREQYYQNYQGPDAGATVQQRPTTKVLYKSIYRKQGTDHLFYWTTIDNASAAKLGASVTAGITAAGLKTEKADTDIVAGNIRGSGVTPSRAHWHVGIATPVVRKSPWNTTWRKYYDTQNGRSHFSVPISATAAAITGENVIATFRGIFVAADGTPNTTMIGAKNGRAYYVLERYEQSILT